MHQITQFLLDDLVDINKTINTKNVLSRATTMPKGRKSKKVKETYTKAYEFELDIPINLSGKYLDAYNNTMNIRIFDVIELKKYTNGFYEYQCKLQQYLSKCGLNRTRQRIGTCWLNTIINCIVFCEQLRGLILQLLSVYIPKNKNFFAIIERIEKDAFKLTQKVDYNETNVFNYFICILYNVLCRKGLRNTEEYNMLLVNSALNINQNENLRTVHTSDVKKIIENIGVNTSHAFDTLIYIFNKNMDLNNPHLTRINTTQNISRYSMNNPLHINKLNIDIINKTISIQSDVFNNKNIQNIKISEFSKYSIITKNPCFLDSLDTVNFIFVYTNMVNIPDTIKCSIDNKITQYNLCGAIIRHSNKYSDKKGNHVITGFICNNGYYIYDSSDNYYYQIDWRDISAKSFAPYINTHNMEGIDNLEYYPAIYCNKSYDFSYQLDNCQPSRP